ncbi:alpha-glucosidase C-terminal domain-containing protein, partial [uncultured Escherichia sp.]|uniref:alpha-glucosidase C-terminal domain-containing protein n=1 Tax=uncultured Escherichia sp. TaxID=237777 RepID=UPI0025B684E4
MNDEDSVFSCYKKLVRLRKEYDVFVNGDFRLLLADDENIFAYTRTNEDHTLLVLCNFYDTTVSYLLDEDVSDMELLVSNYRDADETGTLR